MKRVEATYNEIERGIENIKYILIYTTEDKPYLYDLLSSNKWESDKVWTMEYKSVSKNFCHHCGQPIGKHDESLCEKIVNQFNSKDVLNSLHNLECLGGYIKYEIVTYSEYKKFMKRYSRIFGAFRNANKESVKESFSGGDIKSFMDEVQKFLVNSNGARFKKLILKTIKNYEKYPLQDNAYYFITIQKYSRNFTFKKDNK